MSRIKLSDLPERFQRQIRDREVGRVADLPAACLTHKELAAKPKPAKRKSTQRTPNQTEQRFNDEYLFGRGIYEGVTFHLAGGSRYTPDYVYWENAHGVDTLYAYEVKGSHKFPSENRALTAFLECRARFTKVCFSWYRLNENGEFEEEHAE